MSDLVQRLRDTPNWMRESFGSWKDCVLKYDRAPFEAADEIERLRALNNEQGEELDMLNEGAARQRHVIRQLELIIRRLERPDRELERRLLEDIAGLRDKGPADAA